MQDPPSPDARLFLQSDWVLERELWCHPRLCTPRSRPMIRHRQIRNLSPCHLSLIHLADLAYNHRRVQPSKRNVSKSTMSIIRLKTYHSFFGHDDYLLRLMLLLLLLNAGDMLDIDVWKKKLSVELYYRSEVGC